MNRRAGVAWSGAVRAGLGLAVVAWPAVLAPAWTIAIASVGAIAVALAARRRAAVSVAVGAAVVTCAFSHAGTLALAAEGIAILAYVLASDTPARRQLPLLAVGAAATILVAAALVVHLRASAWLTGSGLIAVVVAFALAVPATRRR